MHIPQELEVNFIPNFQYKPNLGTIKPNMGITTSPTESSALADSLFPKVRQRVLAVLFGTPDRSFYANEVIAPALCNVSWRACQRQACSPCASRAQSQAGAKARHGVDWQGSRSCRQRFKSHQIWQGSL